MARVKYTSAGVPTQNWSAIRSMIIERAFNDATAQGVAYFADKGIFEFLVQAARSVGKYQEFEATRGTVKTRLVADLRTMLTEHSVPNTVRGITLETQQGQTQAKRRIGIPGIVVTTTDGDVLAVRRPGMEEINMSTTLSQLSQLSQEAAAAGIEIVRTGSDDGIDADFLDKNGRPLTGAALAARKRAASGEKAPATQRAPKAPSLCEFSGQPTNGGKFLPGYDAKLKSALMLRYRDENAVIAPDEMSLELRERFATGDLSTSQGAYNEAIKRSWEKFMTPRPSTAKKAAQNTDGLGAGNFRIVDAEGTLLQRVAADTDALDWAVANDFDVMTSDETHVVVRSIEEAEAAEAEDEDDDDDDESDEDDDDDDDDE